MRRSIATITAATIGALVGLTPWVIDNAAAEQSEQPEQQPTAVTVVDRTQGTWRGVEQAATSWDASEHVTVTMATECDPATFCVVILPPQAYDRDWLGYWAPVAKHVGTVQLNTTHPASHAGRAQQWIVCHEVGHAIGLGEVYEGNAGCMVDDYKRPDLPTRATARDLRMLDHAARSATPARTALSLD